MTRLLIALVIHASTVGAAENLETAPIGTAVSDSFELGGKLIPLPDGQYFLAARAFDEAVVTEGNVPPVRPKIARVVLAQIRPPRLHAAVLASVSLKPASYRFNWTSEPCKKEGTLYRADLTGSHGEDENCLLVDHLGLNLGPRAQGIWKDARDWLMQQKVQVPVPVVITAQVTRFQRTQLVSAVYAFNPRMYGCNAPISRSWADSPWHKSQIEADPQRVRFVESVTAWGKAVQGYFDALVTGRASTLEERPAIYSCARATAALD